jgi:V/A-type H+-transporting ATPase subunit I
MSKLEIAGPKELLLAVLELIREMGVLQLEAEGTYVNDEALEPFRPQPAADSHAVSERLFPEIEIRESWLDPLTILDTIAATVTNHLKNCRQMLERHEQLQHELEELKQYELLLGTIDRLIADREDHNGLEFIGITLRDAALVERLGEVLAGLVDGECTLTTTVADNGTLIGLIATPHSRSNVIRKVLSDEQFPELPFPEALSGLPLTQRISYLEDRLTSIRRSLAQVAAERERFARQWLAFYRRLNQWLVERLALVLVTGTVRKTGLCFLIHGWARSDETAAGTARHSGAGSGKGSGGA